MNKVVNWFLLLIIFVFDPLAIAMVIAANFAFSKTRKKEKKVPSPHYSPQPIIPREVIMKELDEEKINEVSTMVGKEEKKLQPIKPSEEDLKKLEQVLGLDKNKDSIEKIETDKKILTYRKRGGDDSKK